ncbi:hypothetical protein O6H91_06G076700 [Diphasiastrum complanatum]|uniref:Uncharacterized protein n=2 Tax=Diphasiastrum complanatum TaxID=34168 RepID=A0ACC2DF93_DIPCM|nr:hypothetical protein O6H91_06G037600 [Diphasiastrum complanatum]KAJ7552919.1 hypothetical protein O6H91_06G076700 [Diphasiastrum complanatum]
MNIDQDRSMLQTMKSCGNVPTPTTVATCDSFDCIPDSLLLLIFNKLADVKALGRCCAVSKRFSDLACKVDNALVRVDCVVSGDETSSYVKERGILGNLLRFLLSFMKPFQVMHRMLFHKRVMPIDVSNHSPIEVLKNFKELQHLRIELPGGELGFEDGVLLKWKAEFGSTLESCVILGASSVANNDKPNAADNMKGRIRLLQQSAQQNFQSIISEENVHAVRSEETETSCVDEESASIPDSFYTDGGLRLRVIWTISSLVAASARHYLLQQIILDHPTLESLILTDAAAQGTLCMSKEQLQDFRDRPIIPSASSNRTQIPALDMKLWYAPYLELPGGTGMKGATLVAIKPSDRPLCQDSEDFVARAFEEPFRTATSILAKRQTYLLEMNSF